MNAQVSTVAESTVVLAMDYGQFCLDGGLGDIDNELELLEQAQAAQPGAGDGTMLVVLCPHQNNFEMSVDVQVFDRRPASDRSQWQQVSEGRLEIDAPGMLSPVVSDHRIGHRRGAAGPVRGGGLGTWFRQLRLARVDHPWGCVAAAVVAQRRQHTRIRPTVEHAGLRQPG
jgi:hypothetical protein